MPAELLIAIIQAIVALAPQIPQVLSLGESAVRIASTGTVTLEEEGIIRAQLDAVKLLIDAA
jgi:hypothetical protein